MKIPAEIKQVISGATNDELEELKRLVSQEKMSRGIVRALRK